MARKLLNSGQFPLTAAIVGANMSRTQTPPQTPLAKRVYANEAREYRELQEKYRDRYPITFSLLDLWRWPDSGRMLRFAFNALRRAYAREPNLPAILDEERG
jgi:hypothetical protein